MKDVKRKRILIASDTHGKTENLEKVFKMELFDAFIFCGDGEGDEKSFAQMAGCPAEVSVVRGNNDYNYGLPFTAIIPIGTHRIFAAHGHTYSLYSGLQKMDYAAREKECDICIFGHLHKPVFLQMENMLYINPGSISEPRQEDRIPTCVILEVSENSMKIEFLDAVHLNVLKSYSVSNN